MTQLTKEQIEKNTAVFETWSEFVKVGLENGKTRKELTDVLLQNSVTPEQIEMMFNGGAKHFVRKHGSSTRNYFALWMGILKLVAGAGLTFIGLVQGGIPVLGLLLVVGGFIWLSFWKRG
jgi:hypothetical protein